jgi:DNA-binding CsgD family transcriptional regulator
MDRPLSSSDLRRLLRVLQDFYALSDLGTYPRRVITALSILIPARFITYNEVHRDPARNRYVWWPPSTQPHRRSPIYKAFERNVGEHPLIAHYARTNDHRPLAISDFLSQKEFHRLKLYQEFYKPLRVEHQLAVTLPGPRGVVIGIAISRSRGGFSERDRSVLAALRPHVIQAYAHALRGTRLKRPGPAASSSVAAHAGLSPRQIETLAWVAKGKTNAEIAALLSVSPRTVQKHLELVYQRLGVESRTAAVMRAIDFSIPILR